MESHIAAATRDMRGMMREARDLATSTSGVVIPREYWNELDKNMLAFGGMREAADVIRTGGGGQLTFPTVSDTANTATLVTEATQTTTSVDPTFSSMTLDAYTYRSFVLVSREFVQDWQFDVNAYINEALAERLARGLNTAFTTGTGSSQPNGVATATSSSGTMGSGTATTITDLTLLEHSVDPARRRNARWMFHDTMLRNLKRMVDSNGQPLWHLGIDGRSPDMIYGYPFTVNQDVAQPTTAGGKAIYFGDFKKYKVRDVVGTEAGPVILRLNERYADSGQIGFFLFSRHDGDLLDAGTDPIRHLVTGSPQS
jgi:HK97 family phage major capsid protein